LTYKDSAKGFKNRYTVYNYDSDVSKCYLRTVLAFLFKSAIQAELDLGLEDLGFWPSYFKLHGLGQVLLSVNRKGNTYFSGIIVRSKWDKPRKRSCEFVFSTVQVHIFDWQRELFLFKFQESEVSNTWVKWS